MKRLRKIRPIYVIAICFIVTLSVIVCMCRYFNNNISYSSFDISIQFALSVCIVLVLLLLLILFIYYNYTKTKSEITKQLRLEKERYKTIIEYSNWNIWEYDYKTKLISNRSNKNFRPILADNLLKIIVDRKMVYREDIEKLKQFFYDMANNKSDLFAQVRLKYFSNDYNWYEITGTTLYDKEEKPYLTIAKTVNIDKQKKEFDNIKRFAERDSLTNLYNLKTIKAKIKRKVQDSSKNNIVCAILIIELENFPIIVDNYGKMFANAILIDFANKLRERVNEGDYVGYMGENKFIMFLDDMETPIYAHDVASSIEKILRENCLGEEKFELYCSIGIAVAPDSASSVDELLENANIALSISKVNGSECITMYNESHRLILAGEEYFGLLGRNNDFSVLDNHSVIDSDIVYNIVDILFEAKDFNTAFNMALLMIGNYYDLDQIGILEQTDNTSYLKMIYSWNSKAYEPFAQRMKFVAKNETKKMSLYEKMTYKSVFSTDSLNIDELEESTFKELAREANIKCVFQCGIDDKNDFKGCIFAYSIKERDDWSSHFVNSLTLLSKIIGGYLAKYRSQESKNKLIQVDHLTKAKNLKYFTDEVASILAHIGEQRYAIIYFDIDNFKVINEEYGYETGDFILIEFAKRLNEVLKEGETFGRVADDKFVVFVKYYTTEMLRKRMTIFKEAISLIKKAEMDSYNITLTAGIFKIEKYDDISLFIDRANMARKSIKDSHRSKCAFAFFTEAMNKKVLKQKSLENIMDKALEDNEFCVYFQPKFNLNTNKICGAEALVRWNRPDIGIIPPSEFVPIFEENAFIIKLDYYIFEKVCEFIRNLIDKGLKVVPISVNFSRLHLNNMNILSKLKQILKKYNLTSEYLEIEITEYALVESTSYMTSVLHEIKRLGFKLAMDDFGSGVSSLNSLRKQPFDTLKLDKDFFQKDDITDKEKIVISNIVHLAKDLEMDIVAEGVETEEQNSFLKEINCPVIQGFLFSKPISKDEFFDKYFA